jgi:hypothetical protein
MIIFLLTFLNFKSPLIYAGLSGIIPGTGTYLLKEKEIAKIYFLSEGFLLTSYFLSENTIKNTVSSYKIFAKIHADANPYIKDENYWINVENFFSYDEYLEYLRRKARILYPDDKEKQEEYVKKNKLKEKWYWEDEKKWIKFMKLRERERKIEQIQNLIFQGIILNHAISFLQTYFVSEKKLKKLKMGFYFENKNYFFFLTIATY